MPRDGWELRLVDGSMKDDTGYIREECAGPSSALYDSEPVYSPSIEARFPSVSS